jgi:urease accessory protein
MARSEIMNLFNRFVDSFAGLPGLTPAPARRRCLPQELFGKGGGWAPTLPAPKTSGALSCATSSTLLGLLILTLPFEASAHLVKGEAIGFVSGFVHPISGLDHIIAMVAVGMWGAQLGAPAIWLLPVTFPLVMACGGFLGLIGIPLPGSEIAISLSGVCLGAAVLTEFRPPLWVAGALVGVFGLFHGYAHGAELPPGQNALLYSAGFVFATGLLHLAGITIGLVYRWPWGKILLRGAGGLVLCGGLSFLWSSFA